MKPCSGILYWFCVMMAVFGIASVVAGLLLQSVFFDGEGFVTWSFFTAPSLLIFIGVTVFLIAFFGCFSVSRRNYRLLIAFSVLMFGVFALGCAGGYASYALRNDIQKGMEESLNKSMHQSLNNTNTMKMWSIMQYDLQCCGTKSPQDWYSVYLNDTLPTSCCKEVPVGSQCSEEHSYKEGCMDKLIDTIKTKSIILAIVAGAIACLQLTMTCVSCIWAHSIRAGYQTV